MPTFSREPDANCEACPRLAAFRAENRQTYPDWFNAPVPTFGDPTAELLIVGLAPGLRGANRTGRPFTGDYAGVLLYDTLIKFGFATGTYGAEIDDGLSLVNCRIANAVRCLPPENKPTGPEIRTCNGYLKAEMDGITDLRILVALGAIAHGAVLTALNLKKSAYKFAHGVVHDFGDGLAMVDSYHCSRYNTNTRRLTVTMFHDVFDTVKQRLSS